MPTDDKEKDETEPTSAPDEGDSTSKDADESEGEKAETKGAEPSASDDKASASSSESEEEEPEEEAAVPPAKPEPPEVADEAPERMRRARPRGSKPITPPPPAASLGKSVVLFVIVFVTLAAGFAFLSSNDPFSERNAPRWRKGQKVQLNITLDPRDDLNLSCASKTVIEGKRCEFEAKNQKFSGEVDDKQLLRPYTTTDGVQFLASGLWTQPELEKGKRPRERFTVACTLTVDGSIASPAVRWNPAGAWNEKNQTWFAGAVSDCKVQAE